MDTEITLYSIIMLLGSAHGLFLALTLINARGGNRKAHYFLALLTLAFAIDLGHEFLYQSNYLLNVLWLAHVDPVINFLYGPSFYLYTRVLTDQRKFQLKATGWLHFLPIAIGIVIAMSLPSLSAEQYTKLFYKNELATVNNESIVLSVISVIAITSTVSIGIYLVLSIRRLVIHARTIREQFSSIEQLTLNWLRNLLIAISVLYLMHIFGGVLSEVFGRFEAFSSLLYIMIVAVIYTMGYLGLRQPVIFSTPVAESGSASIQELPQFGNDKDNHISPDASTKYKTSSLDADMSVALREDVKKHMNTENPYLDSKLTLPQLAKQIGISPNYLSQVINEQFEKNFFDFINDYRVQEAKRLLVETDKASLNIVSIAYDAGFNSKSAFYTAFKKHVGVTPSQFRKSVG